ncbi:MAG TPA: hypothetical protein VH008_24325 [Pseudonocardia sp.]|nr:hypothetical protein [Pseudonocardia sp.]
MSDLAYTVMVIAVFLGLVLALRTVQWWLDTRHERHPPARDTAHLDAARMYRGW